MVLHHLRHTQTMLFCSIGVALGLGRGEGGDTEKDNNTNDGSVSMSNILAHYSTEKAQLCVEGVYRLMDLM